jgi:AAA domain
MMTAPTQKLYLNSSPDASALPVRTVDEIISEAGENVPSIIENLLVRGAVTEFSGLAKKGGKTTFWCHAIAAGARGEDHAGFATEPAKYLYLTEQGNNFAEALRDSGLERFPDHVSIVQFKDVSALGWRELIERAGAEAKQRKLDALIVDTFTIFARLKGSEENESGVIAERMRVLNLVAQQYNIGVVLIRHAGKDGTPRGSSAFEGVADICITIARPEGRHAPTVRKIAGIGRYGEWERNIELTEGGYISLGTDDNVEFRKAVRFAKSVLPASPQSGMKKQEMLDKREGDDKNITARTLDRALAWLVEQGDVGEKQLKHQRGRPKVYWQTHMPRGVFTGVSTKSHHTHTGFGENKPNASNEDTDTYFRQTLSNTYDGGENKSGVDDVQETSFSGKQDSEQKSVSDREGIVVELQPDNISSSLAARSAPREGVRLPTE